MHMQKSDRVQATQSESESESDGRRFPAGRFTISRFEDQILISGDGFSAGGDSGSLIVSDGVLMADRCPVGLLFAGSPTSTIANPIGVVLDRFGVAIDDGRRP